jgi:hypothetical protein
MSKPFRHGRRTKAQVATVRALFGRGDAVRDAETHDVGHIEDIRPDGQMSVVWLESGRREWCHQDLLVWAPDVPTRRR